VSSGDRESRVRTMVVPRMAFSPWVIVGIQFRGDEPAANVRLVVHLAIVARKPEAICSTFDHLQQLEAGGSSKLEKPG
jgi:hypothetical protein